MRQHCLTKFSEVCALARSAGASIMEVYESFALDEQGVTTYKSDESPVTKADIAAHGVILEGLQSLFPNIPVVSEEDEQSHRFRQASGAFWLVDPLDGTKEFLSKRGDFTVNVALIIDREPQLGVVYAPALDELFWGGRKKGAWSQIGTGEEKSLSVSYARETKCPTRVVASRSHLNTETQAFISKLAPHDFIQAGSSLKFCKIAQNQADIYPRLSPTCEWDTATAQAVLEGAGGGYVYDTRGNRLTYGSRM